MYSQGFIFTQNQVLKCRHLNIFQTVRRLNKQSYQYKIEKRYLLEIKNKLEKLAMKLADFYARNMKLIQK